MTKSQSKIITIIARALSKYNMTFSPNLMIIKQGEIIRWKNTYTETHIYVTANILNNNFQNSIEFIQDF